MKKAKIMLTVLAILAVVGGALAFKTTKFLGSLYCTNTTGKATSQLYSTTNISPVLLYCSGTYTTTITAAVADEYEVKISQ